MKPDAPLINLVPDALDDAGMGVGSHEDLRLHVPGALPGEAVSARIVHRSSHRESTGERRGFAELLTITRPSPDRVAPVCPGYGRCGGCVLQHFSGDGQRAWKRGLVVEALAGLPLPEVGACVASPQALGYRNQAKYVVGRASDGRTILGAYAPRSHEIVDLTGCRVGEPPQDAIARCLRDLIDAAKIPPFDERTRRGLLRYVVVRTGPSGEALVALVVAKPDFPEGPALAGALMQALPAVTGVVANFNDSPGNVIFGRREWTLAGRPTLAERFGAVQVDVGAQAFLQLNRGVAALAYAAIRAALTETAAVAPVGRLLDLFAGVGAIAFSVADLAAEIVAVEDNPSATAAGTAAAERAGLSHVRFVTDAAAHAMESLGPAEAVILNPPRAGAGEIVAKAIVGLRPRLVAYLSCNPRTLARDLAVLTAKPGGLVVDSVRPLDMLPHTTHVETLVILRASFR